MTYVADQTSAELRAHMQGLMSLAAWNDPLAARLWKEIQELDEQINECSEYLEDAESPADCIERKHYNEHRLMKRHADLMIERDQLAAQNERLRMQLKDNIDLIRCGIGANYGGVRYDEKLADTMGLIDRALGESASASLAELQAKAIEHMAKTAIVHQDIESMDYQGIMQWADMVRQQEVPS